MVVTPTNAQNAMELQVGKFIYVNSLAFKVVNDLHFVKLINNLRPELKLPSYKKVTSTLLDDGYRSLKEEFVQK